MPAGYWIEMGDGVTAHVLGERDPAPRTAQAIEAVVGAAAEELRRERYLSAMREKDLHTTGEPV